MMITKDNHNMSKPEPTFSFGTLEVNERIIDLFNHQLILLANTRQAIKENSNMDVAIHALIYSAICSGESLSLLAKRTHFRDCYILGRTFFETLLNVVFILSKGQDTTIRAHRHATQKTYRNLTRELEIGSIKISISIPELKEPDTELEIALKEFTGKKGREITSWTEESVTERIKSIEQKYGSKIAGDFQFALFGIYRNASELIHGTLFGALFSIGYTERATFFSSQEDYDQFRRSHISMILLLLSGVIAATIEILAQEIEIVEIAQESKNLIDAAVKQYGEMLESKRDNIGD
jgi:hypothetical protein